MIENKGLEDSQYTITGDRIQIEEQIRQLDNFGIREWILKFTPRYGKVLEAGCGLGRNNFYLSKLGIDIDGIDIYEQTIDFLNYWQSENGFDLIFKHGDVTNLIYATNSLSGYLSFGVVEHFIEGPQRPLLEAYRVLRPGGIAIITTPSPSFYIKYGKLKVQFKNILKRLLLRKIPQRSFYQYYYSPVRLKKFVKESGLFVTLCSGTNFLYTFQEIYGYGRNWEKLKENTFAYKFSHKFEHSFLNYLASQSVTISVKLDDIMYCFFCGKFSAKKTSIEKYSVPCCENCQKNDNNTKYYFKGNKAKYNEPYIINPPTLEVEKRKCNFCSKEYFTDNLFEDYGFNINVCSVCLKKSKINILLSNENLKPIYRQ